MAFDRNGQSVEIGTKVRVLEVADSVMRDLPPQERRDLMSMVGEVFEVYEIDQYGSAWVEKTWHAGDGEYRSHSLGLSAHEMEVVEG